MTPEQMAASLRRLEEGQARTEAKVDKLCTAVDGNGDPEKGLRWRVVALERAREGEAKARERKDQTVNRLVVALVTTVLGCVATAAIGAIF